MKKYTIMDHINRIPIFYIWVFFCCMEVIILYYNESLAIILAILMNPIFIHDLLLKILSGK